MVVFKDDPLGFYSDELFPRYIFDLLPEFHNCFLFEEILNFIDTREIETGYSPIGQRAYHPKLITKILIYSYSQGVFSSRQIEKRCKEDLGFMYISHMNCPNFRVLSDFRKDNYKFFKDCFKKSVELALGMGLVSLGHVSLDGSKFQADTSKHKAMSYKRMLEKEKELTEEIGVLLARAKECDEEEDMEYGDKTGYEISEDLKIKEKRLKKIQSAREALEKREQELNPGKKIEDKKQISFADKEAKIMGKKGNFDYNYNGQISVDSDNQIIIGEHVSQNANDKKEAKPAIEEIKENTGEVPDKMSSDNGYFSGENIEAFENENIDVYMATGKGEPQDDTTDEDSGKLKKNQFSYDIEKDVFVCPNGKTLKLKSHNKDGKKIYQAQKEDCDNCPFQKRCCSSKKGEPRRIYSDDKEPQREKMRLKMKIKSSKEVYKDRKKIVEPVFGFIKNLGFRRFHVRGIQKVRGEFSLICSCINFKKIVNATLRGKICPNFDKYALIVV